MCTRNLANSNSLDHYSPIECKLRSNLTQGGGVGIYLKKNLKFNILNDKSIFVDRVFESV